MEPRATRSRSPSILNLGSGGGNIENDNGTDPRRRKLLSFRDRYPVDDRAYDFLQKAPEAVQDLVLSDFKPKSEGQKDYSALLTIFVRKVQGRWQSSRDGRGGKDDHDHHDGREHGSTRRRGGVARRSASQSHSRGRVVARRRVRTRRRRASSGADSVDGISENDPMGLQSGTSVSLSDIGSQSEYSSGDEGSSCSSSSSSVSADSAAEEEAKRVAQERRDKIMDEALEDENRRLSRAEEVADREADAELERGLDEVERDIERKLASYRETLELEKDDKIRQLKQHVEHQRVERMRKEKEDARAERNRLEDRAETLFEEALQNIMAERRRDRNNMRLQKELKRMETKKTKEEKPKRPPKPVREKRSRKEKGDTKRAKHDEGKTRRRRRRHRGSSEQGRRGRRHRHRSKGGDRDRRRDRGEEGRDRRASGGANADLENFRDRYPMDSRAFLCLTTATAEVQRTVLTRFKPRSEGDDDYSALVMAFVRAVQLRFSGTSSRTVWRDARRGDASQDRSHDRGSEDEGVRDRAPRETRERGRERSENARDDEAGSRSRSRGRNKALQTFRSRYPMDDRAFGTLETATSGVQEVVMSDFKPRREGEEDYSALVMAFVRAVQARASSRR